MTDQPNILMIMADQLAPQALSFYGNRVCKTPNLDRLAANGVTFDNAYCNYPVCVPSRASMMSGRLVPAIKVWDNACELASSQPTLAHHLRHLGYHTVLSGKMHFIGPDQLHGFNERTVTDVYPSGFEWVADWQAGPAFVPSATGLNGVVDAGPAARTLQEDFDDEVAHSTVQATYDLARRGADAGPWFQIASFTSPHTPFVADQRYWDRYDPGEIDMPRVGALPFDDLDHASRALFFAHGRHRHRVTEDDVRRARQGCYAMISFIDDKVGEILAALAASGQADDTVIIFCADHGEMLGERGMWFKFNPYEASLRVPMIMQGPGVKAGHREEALASLVDLLPTFTDIASGGTFDDFVAPRDGQSLFGRPERYGPDDRVFVESTGESLHGPAFIMIEGTKKLVYTCTDPRMFFDLEEDPLELTNLAEAPEHQDQTSRMLAAMMDRWDETDLQDRIRTSQRKRLFVQDAMKHGRFPTWDFGPDYDPGKVYVRGGTDPSTTATKQRGRFPYVPVTPPQFPRGCKNGDH